MLFLGLGTGLGSALITEDCILPLELGHLPYKRGMSLGEALGSQAFKQLGKKVWSRVIKIMVPILLQAFLADTVVLGGGYAKKIVTIPPGARLGHNLTAFRGGFRMWNVDFATAS